MHPLLTAAALAATVTLVLAHDGHNDEWFKSLRNQVGGVCCDGFDAVRVEDPNWTIENGKYRVRLNGEWVDVPENALVTANNRVGFAIVWPYYVDGKVIPRCFMPGAGA